MQQLPEISEDHRASLGGMPQMLQHLQRIGLTHLPNPDDATVQALRDHLQLDALKTDEKQTSVADSASDSASTKPAREMPKPRPRRRPEAPSDTTSTPQTKNMLISDADSASPYAGNALPIAQRIQQLDALATAVSECQLCPKLCASRSQTVFGEGPADARFAFFGEGPGADEDQSGRPFIGKAGQLLTKMIAACGIDRSDCYIFNTVKCRPPNNRNPEAAEIENCRTFFQNQLQLIRPEYLVCLGAIAARSLLKTSASVGRMRGRLHRYHDTKVVVTYHPAYLLREPKAKKAAWDDLQMMMKDAGLM